MTYEGNDGSTEIHCGGVGDQIVERLSSDVFFYSQTVNKWKV